VVILILGSLTITLTQGRAQKPNY